MYEAEGDKVYVVQPAGRELFLTVHPTDTGGTMTVEKQAENIARIVERARLMSIPCSPDVAATPGTVDAIARKVNAECKAEMLVRERLTNNGRNPANGNAGIRVGSDLHLMEMLIQEIDDLRAVVTGGAAQPSGEALANKVIADPQVIWLRECGFQSSARFESELRAAIMRACALPSTQAAAQAGWRWLPIDHRPLETGTYLVGHRGYQEIMKFFGPDVEWAPGTKMGWLRLTKQGWERDDPAERFNATHCILIEPPR